MSRASRASDKAHLRRAERAAKVFEARAASLVSKHVRPEHMPSAFRSLLRGLKKHVPGWEKLEGHEIPDDVLDAHFAAHAARHPDRVVEKPALTEHVIDPRDGKRIAITHNPLIGRFRAADHKSLADAQDAAIAASAPSVKSRLEQQK